MPGLGLQLRINNLQKKNANATAVPFWDFSPPTGATLTGFSVQVSKSEATYIQWGNGTSTNSTARTTTVTKTY